LIRERVGDNGLDFPETEKVVQEFWDYDDEDRKQAQEISHEFLARRLESLNNPPKKKSVPKKK
jgi:hypothetical protein